MHYRRKEDVGGREDELVILVPNADLLVGGLLDFEAVAAGGDYRVFVDSIDDLLGQFLDQTEIDDVARPGQISLDSHTDLVVVPMQGLAKAGDFRLVIDQSLQQRKELYGWHWT